MKYTAQAPATVANCIVGFDILGFAAPILHDRVTVEIIDEGIYIQEITGIANLPREAEKNTAGFALIKMKEALELDHGFRITIDKGIPLSSGLGGSAASAVAAVLAANECLPTPLSTSQLMEFALHGESVASGSMHGDNVAPCLYGGITIFSKLDGKAHVEQLPVPDVWCVIAHPDIEIQTKLARQVISPHIKLSEYVAQSMYLSNFIVALFKQDLDLLKASLKDVIIEPQRARLIPQFDELRETAISSGAMGFSISGAGPSVFSFCESEQIADRVMASLQALSPELPYRMDIWKTQISKQGAQVL